MTKEKACPIKVYMPTYEKIRFMAKANDQTMSKFVEWVFDTLFEVGCEFPKNAEVESTISILGHSVSFNFNGKSRLVFGQLPEAELERMRKEMFEEAKLDIAEKRGKEVKEK